LTEDPFVEEIFTLDELEEFKFLAESENWKPAEGYSGQDESFRKSDIKKLNHLWFPDFSRRLIEASRLKDRNLIVREFHFLRYQKGDYINGHVDRPSAIFDTNRIVSTVTLIHESEDIKGGIFEIQDKGSGRWNPVLLKKGQTLFFDSAKTIHRVTELLSGERFSLIAWIHKPYK